MAAPSAWPKPAYIMCERHLSGHRVICGFETARDAGDFHQLAATALLTAGPPAEAPTPSILRHEPRVYDALINVPGSFKCPKCGFLQMFSVISAANAAVGVNLSPDPERMICRNDGTPLRPYTWQERAVEAEAEWGKRLTHECALRDALASAVRIAGEAAEEWDRAPSGMKAGKILRALAGHIPGYRADTDAIHAALSPKEQA